MTKLKIEYLKTKMIDLSILGKQYSNDVITDSDYNPYDIQNLQLYNPIYERFFSMNDNNYNSITLNHKNSIIDLNTVSNNGQLIDQPIFIKFSPLLDPYRYMIGKYDLDDPRIKTLPTINSLEDSVHPKILTSHNASYVDSFFCFLTSIVLNKYDIPHGIDYYGSYLGLQAKHRLNIADDIEYLRTSEFFNDNIGKYFYIEDSNNEQIINPFLAMNSSRKNKQKLQIDDSEKLFLECEELSEIQIFDNDCTNELESVYSKSRSSSLNSSNSSNSSTGELNYSSEEEEDTTNNSDEEDSDEEDSDEEDSDEEEEEEIYGYIRNFPIQMICMEKCDGTLDELFVKDEMDTQNGASMLMQIVLTLLIYQKMFKFTHNDLHTNNIMYINTDQPFLYYLFNKKTYKVPTYGKIFKIIDFGRSIYKLNEHTFCSDSFSREGDASTQYNCEPFFNDKRPRLEPNNSFDLCRLGSSLFDFVSDIEEKEKNMDDFQKTITRWCLDDNGKNILYKKNGQERYPNFKLYKMIARTVHNHTPEAQLEFDFFKQFILNTEMDTGAKMINIDELPILFNQTNYTK